MRTHLFKPKMLSRHPSHKELRRLLKQHKMEKQLVLRFGSTTDFHGDVEINSIQSIKNSSDKLLMKQRFDMARVVTAKWTRNYADLFIEEKCLQFPIIAKHRFGSRGTGNYKLENEEKLISWSKNKNLPMYIFEEYVPYSKEYRMYCTQDEVFLMARKLLRNGENGEQRHIDNSNFVYEFQPDDDGNLTIMINEQFKHPNNINILMEQSCLAIKAVELDIGCVDIKVQQNSVKGIKRDNPKFIIIETNSAPGCGNVLTKVLYDLIKRKYEL